MVLNFEWICTAGSAPLVTLSYNQADWVVSAKNEKIKKHLVKGDGHLRPLHNKSGHAELQKSLYFISLPGTIDIISNGLGCQDGILILPDRTKLMSLIP